MQPVSPDVACPRNKVVYTQHWLMRRVYCVMAESHFMPVVNRDMPRPFGRSTKGKHQRLLFATFWHQPLTLTAVNDPRHRTLHKYGLMYAVAKEPFRVLVSVRQGYTLTQDEKCPIFVKFYKQIYVDFVWRSKPWLLRRRAVFSFRYFLVFFNVTWPSSTPNWTRTEQRFEFLVSINRPSLGA